MALLERQKLIAALSPPFDNLLCTQLIDEFISSERRYIQRDWEPSQLDGGQFAEVAGRIWYHMDSGTLNRGKSLDECLKYMEGDQNPHVVQPRHDCIHVCRVLKTIYKFRSQRGAVHISPTYSPNHMDSKFVVESVRWVMNETLRVFWSGDREAAAMAIRELLQFDVPAVGIFGGQILIQRTDLSPEEEVLILLHYGGDQGFSRTLIGKSVMRDAPTITKTLQKLGGPSLRQIVQLPDANYRLTDLGSRRIRDELASKLTV